MTVPNNPVQPPAQAEAVALTATAIAVAVTLIVAAGVTWTSVAMSKKCTTQFLTDKPEARQIIMEIVGAMPQTGALVITKAMIPKVKEFMKMVGEYFKGKTTVSVPSDTYNIIGNVKCFTKPINNNDSYKKVASSCFYDMADVISGKVNLTFTSGSDVIRIFYNGSSINFSVNGTIYDFSYYEDGSRTYFLHPVGWWYYRMQEESGYYKTTDWRLGFRLDTYNNYLVLLPMVCQTLIHDDPVTMTHDVQQFIDVPEASAFRNFIILSDAGVVASENVNVNTVDLENIDDINEAIAHRLKDATDEINVNIQDLINEIEAAKEEEMPLTVEGVRELIGIRDELKVIEQEQEHIKEAIKEATREDDMNVPQLPSTITNKFPFCVPFDLIALVKTFNATPVAPRVTVPVVFQSMNYSHDFVFDFSGDNWDKVAVVIRWGSLIFYILGLTLVTRKLIKG
jgi:hypothetical protein